MPVGLHADKFSDKEKDLMENPMSFDRVSQSALYIKSRTNVIPKIGIICGSGLGKLADFVTNPNVIPYADVPYFPESTVASHSSQFVLGEIHGVPICLMAGRFHMYENYSIEKCSMPVRVMKLLGIQLLITTNAAGGIHPSLQVGDIMILKDHINFPGFVGINPLKGPNDERFGSRFFSTNSVYDASLRSKAKEIACQMGIGSSVKEGTYALFGGPNYESPAEIRLLALLGADAIGMSTIHENLVAAHSGLKVFSFSLITNTCVSEIKLEEKEPSHEEVIAVALKRQNDLREFVARFIYEVSQTWTDS